MGLFLFLLALLVADEPTITAQWDVHTATVEITTITAGCVYQQRNDFEHRTETKLYCTTGATTMRLYLTALPSSPRAGDVYVLRDESGDRARAVLPPWTIGLPYLAK